jgi:hypothetical protein
MNIVASVYRFPSCCARTGILDTGVNMSEALTKVEETEKVVAPAKLDKRAEHIKRINRTLVACFMGILAGALAFYLSGEIDPITGQQANTMLGVLFLAAAIVFQKYIFAAIKIDYTELNKKDWFYQGFMTFALWFMTWTILLTTTVLPAVPR